MLFKINKDYEINKKVIDKMFIAHRAEIERINRLEALYKKGTAGALERSIPDHKPNNKIANHYAGYITNTLIGFIFGIPVNILSNEETIREVVESFNNKNDISSHNISVATKASISGYAYELMYIDKEANERVTALDTKEVIYCVDNTVEENPLFAIRYFNDITLDDGEYYIEIYEPDKISYYIYDSKGLHKTGGKDINSFGEVPVTRLINDGDEMGDFERVETQIEAYNIAESDTANDFEYFTDAILALYGDLEEEYDEETGEKIPHDFKNNKVLKFSEGTRAEWLIKQINDVATENYKNRLDRDIHKFSFVPDMSAETFGNASGESLKWRVSGLRYRGGIKIQCFKKLLERRYKLLFNSIMSKKGVKSDIKIEDLLEFKFTENLPKNVVEAIQNVKNLDGIVSERTRTELLEEVTNVKSGDELARLEEERERETVAMDVDFERLVSDANKEDEVNEEAE